MNTIIPGLILLLVGVLAVLGAALNWRIETRSGKLFNLLFGDMVARAICFLVGVFVFVKGIEIIPGAPWLPL